MHPLSLGQRCPPGPDSPSNHPEPLDTTVAEEDLYPGVALTQAGPMPHSLDYPLRNRPPFPSQFRAACQPCAAGGSGSAAGLRPRGVRPRSGSSPTGSRGSAALATPGCLPVPEPAPQLPRGALEQLAQPCAAAAPGPPPGCCPGECAAQWAVPPPAPVAPSRSPPPGSSRARAGSAVARAPGAACQPCAAGGSGPPRACCPGECARAVAVPPPAPVLRNRSPPPGCLPCPSRLRSCPPPWSSLATLGRRRLRVRRRAAAPGECARQVAGSPTGSPWLRSRSPTPWVPPVPEPSSQSTRVLSAVTTLAPDARPSESARSDGRIPPWNRRRCWGRIISKP